MISQLEGKRCENYHIRGFASPEERDQDSHLFGKYTATRDIQVGTLHVGFFDALPREMANFDATDVEAAYCPARYCLRQNND